MTHRIRPERTPPFRVQHPISGNEYIVYLMQPRTGAGTVHIVFDPKSPNAAGVRRVVHAKRRGYGEFLHAAHALLGMTRWHDPRPYIATPRRMPRVYNPDHYAIWDTDHHAYASKLEHMTTISLFADQLADPIRGRGRRLDVAIGEARVAHDQLRAGGAVTSVSRARTNLRGRMLQDVARALSVVGPHHAMLDAQRPARRGPTALGYTREEVIAMSNLWTGAYRALEKLQTALRTNQLWSAPDGGATPITALSLDEARVPVPKEFSFSLDDEAPQEGSEA